MGELGALFRQLHAPPLGAADVEWHLSRLPRDAGTLLIASGDAGRLLLALTERGLRVHGIEASPAELEQCETRLRAAGHTTPLFRQDLDTLNLPFRYAGALIGASVWQAVERMRMAEALQRLRAHLIGPGALIVELVIPAYAEHPPGAPIVEIERVKLDDGSIITRRSEQQVNADAQCVELTERYERRTGAAVTAREDARVTMTWCKAEEMRQLVRDAGFPTADIEDLPSSGAAGEGRRFAVIASL